MRLTNSLPLHYAGNAPQQPWLSQFKAVLAAWSERRRYRKDAGALHRFSDRELWDLGLSRSDLPSIENGTFRRD